MSRMAGNAISLYPYKPSKVAAITCAVIFTITAAVHIVKLFKTRTWFCIPFIVGLVCKPSFYSPDPW